LPGPYGRAAWHRARRAQTLIIESGTLVDGTGRPPIENSIIVIEDSRFKALGRMGRREAIIVVTASLFETPRLRSCLRDPVELFAIVAHIMILNSKDRPGHDQLKDAPCKLSHALEEIRLEPIRCSVRPIRQVARIT
jgi:hypothetical protein